MIPLVLVHYIMEMLRNERQPSDKTERGIIPATVQIPINVDVMEVIKRAGLRDDYRQLIINCTLLIQDEMERDPELKKIITSLDQKDERVIPALVAAGAWLGSPAGLTTIGLVGGAIAGWLSVD